MHAADQAILRLSDINGKIRRITVNRTLHAAPSQFLQDDLWYLHSLSL